MSPKGEDIFDESVFAFILKGNLQIFNQVQDRQLRSSPCMVFRVIHSHSYHTGVGLCLFVLGLLQSLSSDKLIPHFLFI